MKAIKASFALFAFALLLSIPLRTISALPAASVTQPGTSQAVLVAKKKKAVSFCEKQWRQCTAQCKKGKGDQASCASSCEFDFQWCIGFCPSGPNPC
ncbi:MAG TPA: hypothetical protein VG900_07095 [Hyphomicrobiaceae bacterium]|jgi:hypothetical protein|nr:hypothetical protein [Hyphomicrobiaceae bacterium]